MENQLSLFGEPEPSNQERPLSPPSDAQAPSPSGGSVPTYKDHDALLKEMGLRYGATHVYRYQGRFYAWGDYEHCQAEDIEHNIRVLTQRLAVQPKLTSLAKAYDSDTYQSSERLDWGWITREVRELYGEKMFEVDRQGNIVGEFHGHQGQGD